MKFFTKRKDGGPESTVTGYWLVEIKSLFSICFLEFDGASREAFHNHAFNSIAWVVEGAITENMLDGSKKRHKASWMPFIVRRTDFHKVDSDNGITWVLNFRGPWSKTWQEFRPLENRFVTLGHGRKEINAGVA